MQTIAERLILLLTELKIKAVKLAEIIGTPTSTVSGWTTGKSAPNFESLLAISNNFKKVNIHWLVTGEGEMFISEKSNYYNNIPPATAGETPITPMNSDYQFRIIESLVSQNEKLQTEVSNFSAIQKDMAKAQAEMAATQRLNAETILNLSRQPEGKKIKVKHRVIEGTG
ncbi:MAG TPA: helix-turn-helix domain-containing protein [Paludibacteraceae bacterium]|mgnify:CR=1 FL=1|nr:helix-turn-helix domain-containing protein [Paludibacteraceae bacterium]